MSRDILIALGIIAAVIAAWWGLSRWIDKHPNDARDSDGF